MPEPVAPLTGGCMCGAVRFEITEPLRGAGYCHCKRCQRRTGSAFAVSGMTSPGSFSITEGDDAVRSYEPGDGGWTKSFCVRCGSQLFGAHPENHELVVVRLGALDQDPGVRPVMHQFVDYAAPWEPVPDDGLKRFPPELKLRPQTHHGWRERRAAWARPYPLGRSALASAVVRSARTRLEDRGTLSGESWRRP